MRRRTRDEIFLNCPICGKKSYIKLVNADHAICYCNGSLFNRHVLLCKSAYSSSSNAYELFPKRDYLRDNLYEKSMSKWNELEELKSFKDPE